MMQEVNIVYIDDIIDEVISHYINSCYCKNAFSKSSTAMKVNKLYKEIKFDGSQGYERLLQDTDVHSANVILIDNHLFEESTSCSGKFSGKQFKVILRKLLPYVEVLIITQDSQLNGDNIIHKFSERNVEEAEEYYKNNLDYKLDEAINAVMEFDELAADLCKSTDVEKMLVEKILQSINGDNSYDELTKADIDKLISSFKELKVSCDAL